MRKVLWGRRMGKSSEVLKTATVENGTVRAQRLMPSGANLHFRWFLRPMSTSEWRTQTIQLVQGWGIARAKWLDASLRQRQGEWESWRARMREGGVSKARFGCQILQRSSLMSMISGVWWGEWTVRGGGDYGSSGGQRTGRWETRNVGLLTWRWRRLEVQ